MVKRGGGGGSQTRRLPFNLMFLLIKKIRLSTSNQH
jgi:hypothetical protein